MKVLFIGGTGVISTAVTQLCAQKDDCQLTLLNRGKTGSEMPSNVDVIQCDVRDTAAYSAALDDTEWDVVVQWIGFTPDHVETDISLFNGKCRQYIFISSATVYEKPPSHYIITEEMPRLNPYSPYAQNKIACENVLMDAYEEKGFPVTIIRPSYTYGCTKIPCDISVTDYTLVSRMKRGKKVIVHGDGETLWTLTHNTDFARCFVGLFTHPDAIGDAFNIVGEEVLTWNQIYAAIASAAGVELQLVHVPSEIITRYWPDREAGLFGDKMYSMVFDCSKVRRLVPGWHSSVPFAEGVKESIAWHEADESRMVCDTDAEKHIDELIRVMGG